MTTLEEIATRIDRTQRAVTVLAWGVLLQGLLLLIAWGLVLWRGWP